MIGLAVLLRDFWIGLLALFGLSECWRSFQAVRMATRMRGGPEP
jgi:hypothetical protein